jgi:hypothetical protein
MAAFEKGKSQFTCPHCGATYQFGEKTLLEMKKSIEETPSGPNMSVVIPHDPWDPAPYATVETA